MAQPRILTSQRKALLTLVMVAWLLMPYVAMEHQNHHPFGSDDQCTLCLGVHNFISAIPTFKIPSLVLLQFSTTSASYVADTPTIFLQTAGNRDPPSLL